MLYFELGELPHVWTIGPYQKGSTQKEVLNFSLKQVNAAKGLIKARILHKHTKREGEWKRNSNNSMKYETGVPCSMTKMLTKTSNHHHTWNINMQRGKKIVAMYNGP